MYLCIDVGTHAVRAALFSTAGTQVGEEHADTELMRFERGPGQWVEQDPIEMRTALFSVIKKVAAKARTPILAAGISCQRSSVVAWRQDTQEPLSQIISWQDTRGVEHVNELKACSEDIHSRSGLVLSPHYGASKIHWLQTKLSAKKTLITSPLVSYLIACLTKNTNAYVDVTNAGRTQLWNLDENQWDQQLSQRFKVNIKTLPTVLPTCADYGFLAGVGLDTVPLQVVMGDQNAALMGALTPVDTAALVNCGTGAFALAFSDHRSSHLPNKPKSLLRSVAFSEKDQRQMLLEGTVNGAGAALSWLAEQPHFAAENPTEMNAEEWLFQQLPKWCEAQGSLPGLFINAVGGVGSPYWRSDLLPTFTGSGWSAAQKAVAVVESIVFLLAKNVQLLQQYTPVTTIVVTGGLSRLDALCQMLADLSGLPCQRLANHESTLYGTAVALSRYAIAPNRATNGEFVPLANAQLKTRANDFYTLMETI